MANVTLRVNGVLHHLAVPDNELLVDSLRERLGLTGTKKGCGQGECGSCTVIVDGTAVNACLFLTASADGAAVTTIEGLGYPGKLHPIQEAFIEEAAIQCGYCTPGMVMAAKALLDENPDPSEKDVREAISGNICRCTGYHQIVNAVLNAAARLRGERQDRSSLPVVEGGTACGFASGRQEC